MPKLMLIDRSQKGFARYCPTFAKGFKCINEGIQNYKEKKVRRRLERLKKEDLGAAIILLKHDESKIRFKAIKLIEEIGICDDSTVRAMMDALGDDDNYIRREVIDVLRKIGDRRAVPALIEALKDDDRGVQSRAAGALGEIGDPSAVPALNDALKNTENQMEWCVADALGEIGDKRGIPTLIKLLKHEDDVVRCQAINSLAKIGGGSIVQPLIDTLKDKDCVVRGSAVEALGKIGDISAVPAMIDVLKDELAHVRIHAIEALVMIEDISLEKFREAIRIFVENSNDKESAERKCLELYLQLANRLQGKKSRMEIPCEIIPIKPSKRMFRSSSVARVA